MKLANVRRSKSDNLPGVSGVGRLDRRTNRLAGRLHPGDIAIIDHVDLDRVAAESLVTAKVAGVVNAQPSISGRYPNLGPQLLVQHGIALLDNVGSEVFGAVNEGSRVRIEGDELYVGDRLVARGSAQTVETIDDQMAEAKLGLSTQLEAFAANTGEYMKLEGDLLLEGVGVPAIATKFEGRHVILVVRGYEYKADLASLKSYIREYRPLLVGVDGGADVLIDAGYRVDLVIGDMDAVSENALRTAKEVVVHAYPDGRAPGLARVQDMGVDVVTFPAAGTSEDIALLLADVNKAAVIVTVGTHVTLAEFLDRGRVGMASSFLTRLRVGGKLVDARSVSQLYRSRISAAALLVLVLAALVAIGVALAVSDSSHTYLDALSREWHRFVNRVQDFF
ncbi:Uncharacterized membrane-anchored protein [Frankineae bacterium MT45]|nr:Uncharacterized membrane-anchored protein [Frankineae bacterium MT45]